MSWPRSTGNGSRQRRMRRRRGLSRMRNERSKRHRASWRERPKRRRPPRRALTEVAEARLSRTQAIILAEKLAEGSALPCLWFPRSSCAGPWYAHEQSGLTEAFRDAQAEARTAAEARVRAESELGNCRTRLDEKKRALDEQEQPERTMAELDAEITTAGRQRRRAWRGRRS